jgi:hypothetical protein
MMNCREAENEILSRLPGISLSRQLRTHLQQCISCAALLNESTELDSVFQSSAVLEPSPFLWTRIESRLREQSAPAWIYWVPRPLPAWLTVFALVLLSFFLTTFENQTSIRLDLLAENGLAPKITRDNPFLAAQTEALNGSNPFLDAMMPRSANPFELKPGQSGR